MKKNLLISAVLALCLIMSACGNAGEVSDVPDAPKGETYKVVLEVECVENMLFSRYDVNVLVDGEEAGKLEHGKQGTYNVELTEGAHDLRFEKEDDSTVDGSVELTISGDTTVSYKISCTNDQIDVEELATADAKAEEPKAEETVTKEEEPVLTETQTKIPRSSHEYIAENYEEVVAELNRAGFTNVKTEVVYDVGDGWLDSSSKGNVKTVSVNGNVAYEKGEIFEKNCEIIVTYRDLETSNPDIQYNTYTVSKLIKDLENNAMNAKDTHMGELVEITGRIESIDASGKNFYLYPSDDDWAFQGVLCDIQNDEQKEKLKNFVAGDTVTVKGKITLVGEVLGYAMDIYSIP